MAGTTLRQGKYILDHPIGQGVFGLTYRATIAESNKTVVIKTIGENLRQHTNFDRFKQQFLRDAHRLSHCKHPNLVPILDYFEDAGRPYLVMPCVPGQTLAELLQAGVLPEAKAIQYILQVSSALSVLHKAGLLHRDVKPQNIIRLPDSDRVVLCEYGITTELTPGVLQTHANLVSVGYAPLEVYSFQEKRTSATDIYALAATFYCLLTGQPPSPAPVRKALLSYGGLGATAVEEYRLFLSDGQQVMPNLSPSVKRAIAHGLELAAQNRPKTVEDWLSLLPRLKKLPKQQPTLVQYIAAQPSASKETLPRQSSLPAQLKPTLSLPETQLPAPEKNETPQPALAQCLVAQRRASTGTPIQQGARQANSKVNKTPGKPKGTTYTKHKTSKAKMPLPALFATGAIAAAAGLGFGFALRINSPIEPGSTLLHSRQSFPPTNNWPVSQPRLERLLP